MKTLATVTLTQRDAVQLEPGFSLQAIPLRDEYMVEICRLEKTTGISLANLMDEAARVYFAYRQGELMQGFHET